MGDGPVLRQDQNNLVRAEFGQDQPQVLAQFLWRQKAVFRQEHHLTMEHAEPSQAGFSDQDFERVASRSITATRRAASGTSRCSRGTGKEAIT